MPVFTDEEDRLLMSLRGDGMRWFEIADRVNWSSQACQVRHAELTMARAQGMAPTVPPAVGIPIAVFGSRDDSGLVSNTAEVAAAEGSRRLLHAQLQTGQYFGAARAAWLARHERRAIAATGRVFA